MAPSPNVPEEIGAVYSPPTASFHNTEMGSHFPDFSLFGGAESLPEPEPKQAPRLPRRTEIPHAQDVQNVYGSIPQDPTGSDFLWLMTEEPHRSRRRAIMKAHPEVSIDSASASFFFGHALSLVPFAITQPRVRSLGLFLFPRLICNPMTFKTRLLNIISGHKAHGP